MSNFADRYHDTTRATLFDAWYEAQAPRVQERLNNWMLVAAAVLRRDINYAPDTALEMAQALILAMYNKDPRRVMIALEKG